MLNDMNKTVYCNNGYLLGLHIFTHLPRFFKVFLPLLLRLAAVVCWVR